MPKRQQSGQRRAQGGGRTANSEPRIQVFRDFGGVNFEHAKMYDTSVSEYDANGTGDQTDLQMNFVYLQNNVAVMSNKTLETRDDIVDMFVFDEDQLEFTGPVCHAKGMLYVARNDGHIGAIDLANLDFGDGPVPITNVCTIRNNNTSVSTHTWSSFAYYDDKLIATTYEGVVYLGDLRATPRYPVVRSERQLDNPTASIGNVEGHGGGMYISTARSDSAPHRITIAYSYVNTFGPTRISNSYTFYCNYPPSELNASHWIEIRGTAPNTFVKAVELYYSSDNAEELIFLGRVNLNTTSTLAWSYSWYGYTDATSMWPIANLVAPTENYTAGPAATRVTEIDGRIYYWGLTDNPQRLCIGGNPGNLFSVSPGTGGGFVDVAPGSDQQIKHVCKYKTQSGNSIVTMLCGSRNTQREQRFNLVENSVALSNEQSMKSWQAEQVAGAVGCQSFSGALVCEDGLYSVNRYGIALTTMTMEYNSQIRANYVSDAIKPVFTNLEGDMMLASAILLECDGILYLALGGHLENELDNVLFCYDIDLKAWWTYTLDTEDPIINLFHMDFFGGREGIGIVTKKRIYMLPTTNGDDESVNVRHDFLIETAELSTQMPQQGWQYLSQLEFHFDYLIGEMDIEVKAVDMFGRKLSIKKHVSEEEVVYKDIVRMRIDQRIMSYVIVMKGTARFRMTHFLARVYTMSNKIGQVWGFDDSISHRSAGSVHPTFKCYNDVRNAIFT